MVTPPAHYNLFEFVVLSSLRAQQLLAGSVPRVDGDHRPATLAQMEVAAGKVTHASDVAAARQCRWQL